MMGNETDGIVEDLFDSLLKRYQKSLEDLIKRSKMVFHNIDLQHYKLHKISINREGSYIDSPKCLKNKKEITNPKNSYDKCFQYAVTVAINYQKH